MTEKQESTGLGAAVQERVHAPRSAPPKAGLPRAAGREAAVNRDPMREALRAGHHLTDEEVMRMFEREEVSQFDFDPRIVPAGFTYEWKCHEVYGMSKGGTSPAQLERMEFAPVLAEDHPGYFMPNGHKGPVIRDGQGLYKMESPLYGLRARYNKLQARRQVQDQEQVLGIAPAGHGPRDHPALRPTIKTNYEAVDVE